MKGAFLLPILLCATPPAQAQTSVLLDAPVKVTAQASPSSKANAASATTAFELAIIQDSHEFRLTVMQRGNPLEALAAQQRRSGWKDGFLFIRDDCLAASDERRGWRCVVDQVFTFVDGRDGKRLVHLGEVFAGDDCIEEPKLGCALYQGRFTDIYDALENNPLFNRGEAPAPLLELRVSNGQLIVDLDETWGRNQERFNAGGRCLAAIEVERANACVDGITGRRAYFFNSVLATYTGRAEQLTRTRAFARSALCDRPLETPCSDLLRRAALMLQAIRPGEKPRPRTNVIAVPLPAQTELK